MTQRAANHQSRVLRLVSASDLLLFNLAGPLDGNASLDAERGRAFIDVKLQRPLRRLLLFFGNLHMVLDANGCDHGPAINILDVAFDFRPELVRKAGDSAHFQCATKRAGQSAGDSGDQMIQRRRMLFLRLHTIELLDPAMNAINDRRFEPFDVRLTFGAFFFEDLHF